MTSIKQSVTKIVRNDYLMLAMGIAFELDSFGMVCMYDENYRQ